MRGKWNFLRRWKGGFARSALLCLLGLARASLAEPFPSLLSLTLGGDSLQGRQVLLSSDLRLQSDYRLLLGAGYAQFQVDGVTTGSKAFNLGAGTNPLEEWSASAQLEYWGISGKLSAIGVLISAVWSGDDWTVAVFPGFRNYDLTTDMLINNENSFQFGSTSIGVDVSYRGLQPFFGRASAFLYSYGFEMARLDNDRAAQLFSSTTLALSSSLLKNQASLEIGASLAEWTPSLEAQYSTSAIDGTTARGLNLRVAYFGWKPVDWALTVGETKYSEATVTNPGDKPVTSIELETDYSW